MLTGLTHCCRLVRLPGDVSLAQQKVTQYGEDEQWEVQAIVAEATDLSGEAIFLVKWKVGRSLTNLGTSEGAAGKQPSAVALQKQCLLHHVQVLD